jgi:hypothetical protein
MSTKKSLLLGGHFWFAPQGLLFLEFEITWEREITEREKRSKIKM